ncbi:MAG: tRNA adenosine(34) deaminase TadA [Clostridiales bacterium]|nr:tRNA adenosine(34) deaminase TadA [Clostridiales bacterium]
MTEKFMKEAIKRAKKAADMGETPVGAIIVRDGKIIASGYNRRETKKNALLHAEITAIDRACKKLGGWRLIGCDMYVTLEPCPMCAGAIINSRIENLYFGAFDKKAGCAGSVKNLFEPGIFNHNVNVEGGILEEECRGLLTDFFRNLRRKKKEKTVEIHEE